VIVVAVCRWQFVSLCGCLRSVMLLMQAACEEVIRGSERHRDRCRLPVPVSQQAALPYAACLHLPPQNGPVWGGEVCASKRRRQWSTSTSATTGVCCSGSVIWRRPAVTGSRHRCCSGWLPDVRRIHFTYILTSSTSLPCYSRYRCYLCFVMYTFPIKSIPLEHHQ